MSNVIPLQKNHLLIGTWIHDEHFGSTVEYSISAVPQGFDVVAIDVSDGENGQVRNIEWNGDTLSFSTYWRSTARLCECKLRILTQDQLEFTVRYAQREIWTRKRHSDPTR